MEPTEFREFHHSNHMKPKIWRMACKPDSVPVSRWQPFILSACCQTPSSSQPEMPEPRQPCRLRGSHLLFDLAPGGACHAGAVARTPVRSYRTFSPYPRHAGLSDFCGAVPWIAPAGRYPAPLSRGVRTFLACARLPGHPPKSGLVLLALNVNPAGVAGHHGAPRLRPI